MINGEIISIESIFSVENHNFISGTRYNFDSGNDVSKLCPHLWVVNNFIEYLPNVI